MEIIKHDQAIPIKRFDLFDFVDKIKLDSDVLEHMQDTNLRFDEYFSKLSKYDDDFVLDFWISLAYDELNNSKRIENHNFSNMDLTMKDVFFDRICVSHNRIHNVNKFVMKDEKNENKKSKAGSYRENEVRISYIDRDYEEIFWYGVNPEDVKYFMDNFLEVYKIQKMSLIDSNAFFKSALIHLLFIKIHPYSDGNGRTSRILHNIKFTEIFNRLYGMNLKISPVNLSKSINVNKITYIKILDSIFFDLEHDNNEMINRWFNFILNMYDEQLFMNQNRIDNIDEVMEDIFKVKEKLENNKNMIRKLTR